MKKLFFISLSLIFGLNAFSQCSVDLGDDFIYCFNEPAFDLAANITVQTPGGDPYILSWDNGIGPNNNPMVSPQVTTTYEVTMSDGLGCVATDQITITVSHPIADAGSNVFMCQENPGQLDGTGSSGAVGSLDFFWQNNVDDQNVAQPFADVNGNTVISLVVVDLISLFPLQTCTSAPDEVNVLVFNTPNVDAGSDIEECFNSLPSDLQIPDGTPGGGDWSIVTANNASVTLSGLLTPQEEETITLEYEYTNGNGCVNTDEIIVEIFEAPVVTVNSDFGLCQNSGDFQLQVPGTGTWSGNNVTAGGLFSPLTVGDNILTYTEITGICTSTDEVTIEVYEIPTANAGNDFTICESTVDGINGIVTLGSNAIDTYLWTGNDINGSDNNFSVVFNPSVQSTYTFTVTDVEGCSHTDEVTVSINNLPNVDAGADISICHSLPAQDVNLNGIPVAGVGETGTWSGVGVTPAGVFTDPGVGTYTLTYTFLDANGCTDFDELEIDVVSPDNANQGDDEEICLNDGTLQLTQPGTWSGTNVTANGVFTPATEGVFTLDFETTIGICTVQGQLDVTVLGLPTVDAGADIDLCLGSSVQLNGNANTPNTSIDTYLWTGSDLDDVNIANPNADPTTDQSYTITVTDDKGCTSSDDVDITINPLPIVDAGVDISICHSLPAQNVNLSGSPVAGVGETGTWSGVGVTPSGVFTDPGVGTYTLTYTFLDANGCTDFDELEIEVVSPDNANPGDDEEICLNDGTLQLTQPGTWSGTNVTANGVFTPATAGVFTLDFETTIGICTVQGQLDVTVLDLPTADAGTDIEMCSGLTVQLDGAGNTPNTSIDTYLWSGTNIDDLNIANPNADPTTDQTYTLTVTDDKGCTASDDVDLTIVPLPSVNTGADIELCNQAIVENLDNATPIGGTWSGAGITNPSGEYTPSSEGVFDVTYTYTDPVTTCTNSNDLEITVIAPPLVDAGSPNSICVIYPELTLSGFTPTTGMTWTGPGITDPSGLFDPDITGVGVFSVTISTGVGTCYVEDSKDITVLEVEPVDAGANESVCLNVAPFDLSGATPAGGTWTGAGIIDAANGTFDPSTGIGPYILIYSYVHPVTGCVNTDAKTINVLDLPVANFTVTADQCQNLDLDIVNNSTGATAFDWDFGNGDDSDDEDPNYSYSTTDTYTIELIASNAGGCESTTTEEVTVIEVAEANFTVSDLSGCGSLDVIFTNTSSGDDLDFTWDFDNGEATISDITPPTTTFTDDNNTTVNYSVTLDATNYCGTDQATINILINPFPLASFTTDDTEYCTTNIPVTNTSIGEPTGFEWDFGGLGTSIQENPPAFDYVMGTNSIDYLISLEVTNICGTDTHEETITVLPAALSAGFATDVVEGCAPLTVMITDQSSGATDYTYSFGDGGTDSNLESPTYEYTTPGTYVLNQNLENLCSTDVESLTINVWALPAMAFSSSNTSFCDGQAVQFNNDTPDLNNVSWEFGDSNISSDDSPENTYLTPGNYDVTLSGTSGTTNCPGTITETITINLTPTSSFTPNDITGCSPFVVNLENTSTDTNNSDWNFGDGAISTDTNPQHTFINLTTDPVTYNVSLISTSIENCSNSFQSTISVNPSPEINFTLSSYESCDYPVTVSVDNNTIGADSYAWSISTQGTTIDEEPVATFISPGSYDFTVIAGNEYSCSSTETQEYTVHSKPIVNYLSDVNSGCSNLEVEFFNQSVGATEFEWDFGDGSFSLDESPVHIYLTPGEYQVRLKAVNTFGCEDSISNNGMIEVFDSPLADFTLTPEEIDIFDPNVSFFDASEDVEFWNWDFGDGETSTITNPEHEYAEPGIYSIVLSVMNQHGCIDQHLEEIEITSDLIVFVPNAFSPNADGFNDVFTPSLLGKEFASHYKFQIYNRWGEVIFQTDDPNKGWRGDSYNGEHYVPEGNYTWSLEFKLTTEVERIIQKGTVYMFR